MEVHAAEHHKKEDEQADQQHLQVAGEDQSAVVCHGDAHRQPVGLALAQAAELGDACIGAVGADQLGQPAAHAAQHQHVPGGVVVAAGGAAAEGGVGGKAVPAGASRQIRRSKPVGWAKFCLK